MNKAFTNFTWEDSPSTNTPLSAENLNKINNGLDTVDDRVIDLDTRVGSKSTVSVSNEGTSTDEVKYITVNNVEKKIANDCVWGSVSGTLANQTDLQTELTRIDGRCDNLQSMGRYLAQWDCTTGLPLTNPTTMPYTYKAGDYYRVNAVSSGTQYLHTVHYNRSDDHAYINIITDSNTAFTHTSLLAWLDANGYSGVWDETIKNKKYTNVTGDFDACCHCTNFSETSIYLIKNEGDAWLPTSSSYFVDDTVVIATNKKPNGTTYNGTATSTLEPSPHIAIGDVYFYDGVYWTLQINHSADVYNKTEVDTLVNAKESKGKITVNGTEYQVAISTTDAGTEGYITFVVDSL